MDVRQNSRLTPLCRELLVGRVPAGRALPDPSSANPSDSTNASITRQT